MIILLRHGNDEDIEQTFAHDHHVQKEELREVKRKGKILRSEYGTPDYILTSPFRRTITTSEVLRGKHSTPIHVTKKLGRIFTKKDQKHPEVSPDTLAYGVDVYETKEMYMERVRAFCRRVRSMRGNIWVVTHAFTFKCIAKELGHTYHGRIAFLQHHVFP